MMGITQMTLPMNTSLNVIVSLGVSGGAAETVGNAADSEADAVAIGRGLDEALWLVFLRMAVLFFGLTGAVKHWALGWR